MTNPLEEYLEEKHAGAGDFTGHMGQAFMGGLGTAVAAGAVAATGMAASHIYDAVTKARDFKDMLRSPFNQDLHSLYAERPKEFNAAYSSLRVMNPSFSKDPMVAGTYLRRMMTFTPEAAGGALLESLQYRKSEPENPLEKAFLGGAAHGAGQGYGESVKAQHQVAREGRDAQKTLAMSQLGHEQKLQQQSHSDFLRQRPPPPPKEGETAPPPPQMRSPAWYAQHAAMFR